MGNAEPEPGSPQRAFAPLVVTQRTLGQGLAMGLAMQYALGRGALELTRLATHQQLDWLRAATDADQQAAREAVDTGFDAIEAIAEESERTATESVAATDESVADAVESTFDAFLDTAAPLGHPPERRLRA